MINKNKLIVFFNIFYIKLLYLFTYSTREHKRKDYQVVVNKILFF